LNLLALCLLLLPVLPSMLLLMLLTEKIGLQQISNGTAAVTTWTYSTHRSTTSANGNAALCLITPSAPETYTTTSHHIS
jgi:hypothetical protein